jgi:hypothetical protein
VFNRTIITVAAAVALGCMPVATNALATPSVVTAADRSTTLAMATMATAPQVSSFPLSAV